MFLVPDIDPNQDALWDMHKCLIPMCIIYCKSGHFRALLSYNPFASYAHPPIVRDHANVHEIGSHIPVVAGRYPWIFPSCGFDIAATGRKKNVILYLKTPIQSIIIIIVYFCRFIYMPVTY